MGWLDGLKNIENGNTIPSRFEKNEVSENGDKVINFRTIDSEFQHIEKMMGELEQTQRILIDYKSEVEKEIKEAENHINDLKARLHTARNDFMERLQHVAPEGWEIIVREKKDKAKEVTAPDKIVDTVRGIDRAEK